MNTSKKIAVFITIVVLQACKHPLSIVGEGDIVDLNDSGHGCTLEQFQAQDIACTENEVTGSYDVIYQAIPKPGWKFVRWDGLCGNESRTPLCRFKVTREGLEWLEENYSDAETPIVVAVFERITTEFTEAEVAAIDVIRRHMKARNNSDTEALSAENNYPHPRLAANGGLLIWETPEDYINQAESIIIPYLIATGWHHSQWDIIEIVQSGSDKVHLKLQYSRFDAEGKKYLTAQTFWAVTNQDGHWGIKMRSSYLGDSITAN
jgi:hypothetical protein